MDYKGKKVLVIEGYARQCLPLMRSLRHHGCEIWLLCNSRIDLGYVSRLPHHKILGICDPDRYEASEQYIVELIKKGSFDLVIPLVDFSARILSEHKQELSQYAAIASNERDVFTFSQDKLSVMKTCMETHIPCPYTIPQVACVEDVLNSPLQFPIIVKPRRGCGARGLHLLENKEALLAEDQNICWRDSVVQEYIPQNNSNLSSQLFIDNDGVVKSGFVYRSIRWYPLKGGTGTMNQLVVREDIVQTSVRLAKTLGLKGWIGIDFIDDPRDGISKVIEVNPRIIACATIGSVAGIDLGLPILQQAFHQQVDEQQAIKKQLSIRVSQTDVLWFLKSPTRFTAKPSWFCCRHTKDQMFSWSDPLPWFAFLIRGMMKYNKEMDERK